MPIRVALYHRTSYKYDRPVALGPQVIRLKPAPQTRTHIESHSLKILPKKHFLHWMQDAHGNFLARMTPDGLTDEFQFEVDLIADLEPINPFDFFLEPQAEKFPFEYTADEKNDLEPCLDAAPLTPRLRAFVEELRPTEPIRTTDFLVAVNQRLKDMVSYVIRMEHGVQEPEFTLESGSGSCRDSAWLLVQAARHLGLAARFVSGYLIQLVADQKPLEGPEGPKTDFTDLHAWAEVYLPGAGWVGLDATSGLFAGEGHIPLACAPEPSAAAPVSGLVEPAEVTFSHEMRVERVRESPRVTKPYTDAQWAAIDSLGDQVDRSLVGEDARLTMGGEPTFVSIDFPDLPEWNTDADGPTKRERAEILLRLLVERTMLGGLMHFGQGKWYPGEPLPRWAYGCFGRVDGKPFWRDTSLVANGLTPAGHQPKDAQAFIQALARRLEVGERFVVPGFEDAFYYMWRERNLPSNVTPEDNRLKDPIERARLRRVFQQGLNHTVGFALPLDPLVTNSGVRWRSGTLFLREETLWLLPGDSPMGYRLPLDSYPWVTQTEYPYMQHPDPFWTKIAHQGGPGGGPGVTGGPGGPGTAGGPGGPGGSAGPSARIGAAVGGDRTAPPWDPDYSGEPGADGDIDALRRAPLDAPRPFKSAPGIIRTTLCAETRGGILRIFMPPIGLFVAYEHLVNAIEATAAELGMPVRLEGYPPPSDPRLQSFSVTPDPGVIEVNVTPSRSWKELRDRYTILYECARESRLSAEKFMIDGRHVGTGGGNHIVVGGSTPPDSPILRRPDLLRSLVAYFHDHPSLSYTFSGMFIGPTSQAPRIDEARQDYVHEIEVAFAQIPERGGPTLQPWLVDRLFRNLLTDMTGNTHRAEFCIDKLYSPDGATGRLGLLEVRGFEMPPHSRMSLAVKLLIRALVAKFWHTPYLPKLPRWGTTLHDRFMLPYFVEKDFDEVLAELGDAGFKFDPEWFAPHLEFRFPKIGSIVAGGVDLELRFALEPWHVLGEQGAPGGTARYVDSSLERVQVRVSNATDRRHVITCNGRKIPLHPTGRESEQVAGVRFRAWQPPECLHPTIGVHAPLVFDVVDTWSGRSLGGCTYNVSHPGGRNYETRPVNALEAEARRKSRFSPFGHTPGPMVIRDEKPTLEFPLTLDLRHS
ncbi:MAG TPA: transglutaminase family protein [Polyangiales bacterium]|nr:transglutaminase family protein [Polyangiales bacterium]